VPYDCRGKGLHFHGISPEVNGEWAKSWISPQHPEDRIDTVMSGFFHIGLGDRFDADKVEAHPPGNVIVLPGDTFHFHSARSGEYFTQATAIGPLGLAYLDPGDDPCERNRQRAK
jgi:hypothetical protein